MNEKIKCAAAVALHGAHDQILVARRSDAVDEFKGCWSLPSKFYPEGDSEIKILSESLLKWFRIGSTDWKLIGERTAERPAWMLRMRVYSANAVGEAKLDSWKYDAVKWVDGEEFFGRSKYSELGDCAKTYLDFLKSSGAE